MRYQACVCPVPQCSEQLRSKDLRQPGDMPSECPNCGNGINWDTCAECNLVWNWSSVDRPAPKALHMKKPLELLNPALNLNNNPMESGDGNDKNDDQGDDVVAQRAFSYDVDKAEHAGMPIELPD